MNMAVSREPNSGEPPARRPRRGSAVAAVSPLRCLQLDRVPKTVSVPDNPPEASPSSGRRGLTGFGSRIPLMAGETPPASQESSTGLPGLVDKQVGRPRIMHPRFPPGTRIDVGHGGCGFGSHVPHPPPCRLNSRQGWRFDGKSSSVTVTAICILGTGNRR
jgi:hypothetical protein